MVYSRTGEEHLQHVEIVLEILREHKLFVKMKKCEFGKNEVEYMGHIGSGEGVKVDQDKIQPVKS